MRIRRLAQWADQHNSLAQAWFADGGRRLVFPHGIIFPSVLAGLLLIVFKDVTDVLIPLFAVGALLNAFCYLSNYTSWNH